MAELILRVCDKHADERRPGDRHNITIDGKTFETDTCGDCFEDHLAPLLEFLDEYGQETSKPKVGRPAKARECPDCGMVLGSKTALYQHRNETHGQIPCGICEVVSASSRGFYQHRRQAHPEEPKWDLDKGNPKPAKAVDLRERQPA